MSWITGFRYRLHALVRRDAHARQIESEIDFHLSLEEMHGAHAGMSAADARAAARRRFGNPTFTKESAARTAGWPAVDDLLQDLRFAVRTLGRSPRFLIGAGLTFAIGIGATTAAFSVVDAVLLRGLPYADDHQLVEVLERTTTGDARLASYPRFREWMETRSSWNGAIEGMAFVRGDGAELRGESGPERVTVGYVTPGFFGLLGGSQMHGRTFAPAEELPGAAPTAVISHRFWQRRFGSDPGIVGRTATMDGTSTRIVGVAPPGYAYPEWAELWRPIAVIERTDSALASPNVHVDSRVVLRIARSATLDQARTALESVQRRLAMESGGSESEWKALELTPLRTGVVGDVGRQLSLLGYAVALVLVLACANVANLTLVRVAGRARELAVRGALGAGRGRVVRQLMTETLVVALVGGALGVGLAYALVGVARHVATEQLPRADEIVVGMRVLAFTTLTCLLAAIAAGLVPALRATSSTSYAGLKGSASGVAGVVRDSRLHRTLVVVQLALSLVLLTGAGLLLRSFRELAGTPLGFEPSGRVAIALFPDQERHGEPDAARALYDRVVERVSAVPGVRSVALVNHLPLSGASVFSRLVPSQPSASPGIQVLYRTASAEYQRTIGMRVVAGRWFGGEDIADGSGVVLNETVAKAAWGTANPVGQRVTLHRASQARPDVGEPYTATVLGVVTDVRTFGVETPVRPEVFVPYTREVWPWITLVAHVTGRPPLEELRRAVLDVDPSIPVAGDRLQGGFATMEALLDASRGQRRMALGTVAVFAAVALVLAIVGMYTVVAYGMAQRTRELGVRLALGATRGRIVRLVMGEAGRLAALGAAVGVVGALGMGRYIQASLYQTPPNDPITIVTATATLCFVALAACWGPARRAADNDPSLVLRGD